MLPRALSGGNLYIRSDITPTLLAGLISERPPPTPGVRKLLDIARFFTFRTESFLSGSTFADRSRRKGAGRLLTYIHSV